MPARLPYPYDDAREIAARSRTMAGLDFLRWLIAEGRTVPITATLGFTLTEAHGGRVVFAGTPEDWSFNPMGTVHGGWYASVLDAALGSAVQSTLPAGVGYTTLELKVNLVRGAKPGVPLRCEGRLLHTGRTTALTEADLRDAAGTLHATATSTCLVLSPPLTRP